MIKPMTKYKLFRSENAQTMVEFALVFPIVLLITYGIMEFGRMLFMYTALTSAAREGARYGLASGVGPNGIVQYADCAGIRKAVRSAAFLISIPNDADIEIKWLDVNSSLLPYTCAQVKLDPGLIHMGYQVRVRIMNLTFQPLIGGFLGIKSFPIPVRMNTRTILMGVEIDEP